MLCEWTSKIFFFFPFLFFFQISDVRRVTRGAFNWGSLTIEGSAQFNGVNLGIEFQNENYVAFTLNADGSKNILATVPDLISLVDEDTGEPVTTEEVRYGLRVAAITMPCSPLWTKPQGLATGGPAAFGYQDIAYSHVDSYKEHPPFPKPWLICFVLNKVDEKQFF